MPALRQRTRYLSCKKLKLKLRGIRVATLQNVVSNLDNANGAFIVGKSRQSLLFSVLIIIMLMVLFRRINAVLHVEKHSYFRNITFSELAV